LAENSNVILQQHKGCPKKIRWFLSPFQKGFSVIRRMILFEFLTKIPWVSYDKNGLRTVFWKEKDCIFRQNVPEIECLD